MPHHWPRRSNDYTAASTTAATTSRGRNETAPPRSDAQHRQSNGYANSLGVLKHDGQTTQARNKRQAYGTAQDGIYNLRTTSSIMDSPAGIIHDDSLYANLRSNVEMTLDQLFVATNGIYETRTAPAMRKRLGRRLREAEANQAWIDAAEIARQEAAQQEQRDMLGAAVDQAYAPMVQCEQPHEAATITALEDLRRGAKELTEA